jgi:hypothetical protein
MPQMSKGNNWSYWAQQFSTAPEGAGVDIVDRIVSDSIIIDRERFVGLPEGLVFPYAIAVYEVRDGKIRRVWFPPAETN